MTTTVKTITKIYLIVAGLFAGAFTVGAIPSLTYKQGPAQGDYMTPVMVADDDFFENSAVSQEQIRADLDERIQAQMKFELGAAHRLTEVQ